MPWALVVVVAAPTVTLPQLAWAADNAKFATTMAKQALAAYLSGDFSRAAQLYLEAYRSDPRAGYLCAAARAQHLGGAFDKALEHYRQALALADLDASLRAKTQAYMAEILLARADAKAVEAEKAARTGDLRLAAQLYHDAFTLAPLRFDWLFKAAVAEQMAGDLAAAARDYDAYLQGAPAAAEDRNQARVRLDGLRGPAVKRAIVHANPQPKAVATSQPGPTVAPRPREKPALTVEKPSLILAKQGENATRWLGWSLIGGGVGLLAGGAGLYFAQGSDRKALDDAMAQEDNGKIVGIGYDAYFRKREDLNAAYRNAAILGGVGAVAVGVGAWWLVRTPVRVSPGPGAAGVSLAWGF